MPPCPSGPLRELEIPAWQYPVQPSLSSSGTTSGTELTIIPDGSIPLGHGDGGYFGVESLSNGLLNLIRQLSVSGRQWPKCSHKGTLSEVREPQSELKDKRYLLCHLWKRLGAGGQQYEQTLAHERHRVAQKSINGDGAFEQDIFRTLEVLSAKRHANYKSFLRPSERKWQALMLNYPARWFIVYDKICVTYMPGSARTAACATYRWHLGLYLPSVVSVDPE